MRSAEGFDQLKLAETPFSAGSSRLSGQFSITQSAIIMLGQTSSIRVLRIELHIKDLGL